MPKRRYVQNDDAVKATSGFEKMLEHSILTPERERMYAKLYHETRDEESRRILVESNYRLVAKIAETYRGSVGASFDFDDLIAWGTYGLIRAIEKFDYTMGYKLSTYATFWIRQAIGRAVTDHGRTIRLPAHVGQKLRQFNKKVDFLRQVLMREPTLYDIEEQLGYSEQEVAVFSAANDAVESLDVAVGESGKRSRHEATKDETDELGEVFQKESRNELVSSILSKLFDQERMVIGLRYGLFSVGEQKQMTLEEVSWQLGITRERVRQIESRAIKRLRNSFGTAPETFDR